MVQVMCRAAWPHGVKSPVIKGLALTVRAHVRLRFAQLTPDNFDDVVFKSGKAAFIKFLAPW